MLRVRMLAIPLVGLGFLGGNAVASGPQAAIDHAAAAPIRAFEARDARELCADLLPSVAAKLVPGASPGIGCEGGVSQLFAETAPNEEPANGGVSVRALIRQLQFAGQHAVVKLVFKITKLTRRRLISDVQIGERGPVTIALEEVGGSWLVSSPATLTLIGGCRLVPPRRCAPGAKVLLFSLGEPEAPHAAEGLVAIPRAVRRAGRREQGEFKTGMAVASQSGCAACHRFGKNGNRGPGPNLTHIGSTLSERQIAHILRHPRAPMPSFRAMPANRFSAIVRFLTLLRR